MKARLGAPSLALALLALLSTGTAAQDGRVIQSFSGSGGTNTRPFSVGPGWEIQWDAQGSIFQLYLYSGDGEMLGVPANQQAAGEGTSYQPTGGEYYLQVNAIGTWKIDIVQVAEQTRSSDTTTFSGSGGKNTRPFTVDARWEIQWDASGSIFQLYLYSADGSLIGVPANQQGPGKGTSYQPRGGRYYLQVNAIGDWEIKIVPLGG
ncbi:MAG: hypothetical protein WD960_04680 [Gemmatimonadota bacterium]